MSDIQFIQNKSSVKIAIEITRDKFRGIVFSHPFIGHSIDKFISIEVAKLSEVSLLMESLVYRWLFYSTINRVN